MRLYSEAMSGGGTPRKEKRSPKNIPVRSLPAVQWMSAPRGGAEGGDGAGAEGLLERNVEGVVGVGGGRLARYRRIVRKLGPAFWRMS